MKLWAPFVFVLGCLPTPVQPTPRDASSDDGGVTLGLRVEDSSGSAWPSGAAPRRPRLVLTIPGGALGDPEPVMLLRGDVTAALRTDLERAPILAAHLPLLVAVSIARVGDEIVLTPTASLELGGLYTVVVAGWAKHANGLALDALVALPFQVATEAAGASIVATFPPDRSGGLPTALPRVFIAFDDDVSGIEDIVLERPDGSAVASATTTLPCEDVGLVGAACVALDLGEPLEPATSYTLVVGAGVVDRGGASVGPATTAFTTGSGVFTPTALSAPTCAPDERRVDALCLLVQDDVIRLRTIASNATYGLLDLADRRSPFFAPRGEIAISVAGLEAGATYDATLTVFDATGASIVVPSTFTTESALARVFISEIRHDPAGPEPAQEYVELANDGDEEIDLSGFTLSDKVETLGDVLPPGARIAARARVLLVPDAFASDHVEDAPVPAGVVLVRIGSALATSGISNGGEALFLRDAAMRRVAEAPAMATTGEGRCIVRTSGTSRLPRPGDYTIVESLPCSPGY